MATAEYFSALQPTSTILHLLLLFLFFSSLKEHSEGVIVLHKEIKTSSEKHDAIQSFILHHDHCHVYIIIIKIIFFIKSQKHIMFKI